MPAASNFQSTDLYGGAIKVQLPSGFVDASQFREVPDTQEVYVNDSYDDSIVFDLMERIDAASDTDALKEHLDEISQLNGADLDSQLIQLYSETHSLVQPGIKPRASPAYITVAIEPAKKWGRTTTLVQDGTEDRKLQEPILVLILVLIRLKSVDTDVLVSYNTPITREKDLKSIQEAFAQAGDAGTFSVATTSELPPRVQEGVMSVKRVIDTLEVEDWTLFG